METQLEIWNSRIERLVSRSLTQGAPSNFNTLIHVDELKVLYALALSKLGELKGAPESDRARLEAEARKGMDELGDAFTKPWRR
jgi:hypothetical protein